MVNGVNFHGMRGMQQFQRPDPTQMFNDLSQKVGADQSGITKENLENYLSQLQESGNNNGRETRLISKMVENFDKVSGGTDKITAESFKQGMESLRPERGPKGSPPDPAQVYKDIAQKVGADQNGITKENLEAYLSKVDGNTKNKENELISKLLEDFDKISGTSGTITLESLTKAFEEKAKNHNNQIGPQDPSTITKKQLEPPIDIRV